LKVYEKHDFALGRDLHSWERLEPQRGEIALMKDYLDSLDARLMKASDDLTEDEMNKIASAVENAFNAVKNATFLGLTGFVALPVEVVEWRN